MNPSNHSHHRSSQALTAVLLLLLLLSSHGCAHRRANGKGFSKGGLENGQVDSQYPWKSANDGGSDGFAENVPLSGRPNHVNFDSPKVRKDLFESVHFAFDRYEVSPSEMPKIQRVSDYLRSRSAGVIIAGHTDSLGTVEYNRNLGERRALAIRDALLQLGADASRVQTVSFGEDRPAQPGTSEAAHSANRRAEFGVFDSVSQ